MANPPPPYADITGISRTVMKDNAQETLTNYNGNARPGEIVADLTVDPPTLYVGNNLGQLTLITSSGNSTYGNSDVATYLAAGLVGNIIPNGNAVYSLGNATNQWSDLYVANSTIYLGGVPLGVSGTTLTVNGEPVLSNNGTSSITSTGNITANIGTFNNINTSGAVSATGNITGAGLTIYGTGVVTGNLQVQGNLIYNNLTNITTANLVFGLANTVTGISANGAGWVVGNTSEASWLYNYGTQNWDTNIGISSVGNVVAGNIRTAGSITSTGNVAGGNLIATTALVAPSLNITGNVIGGNILTSGLVSATGNVSSGNTVVGEADGTTGGTAFIAGPGAQNNIALGFLTASGTPAQMSIRDLSDVTSTMYFDASAGGSANGVFNFRTSNAFTSYATIANTGLTVNSTQISNTNVNSTIYYNTGTSQFTAGPSMAAFSAVSAPFSGNITAAKMGNWFQAGGNIVLPQYTTVPVGTTFTITNSASGSSTPIRVTVFNASADFLYYPPQYGTTNRFIELFFGQWMTVVSRGTGEWDVVATNINTSQSVFNYVATNTNLGLDLMNFRYNGTRPQFSPVSGSFIVQGQTLSMVTGSGPRSDAFGQATYSSGTWYDLVGVNLTIAGSTSVSYLTAITGSYSRTYRATFSIDNTNGTYLTIERILSVVT